MDILIVESSAVLLNVYKSQLREPTVHVSSSPSEAISLLRSRRFQLALIGSFGDHPTDVMRFLEAVRRSNDAVDVIVVAERSSEDLAIASIRCGAWDYLRGPVSGADVLAAVNRWIGMHHGPSKPPPLDFNRIVGISLAVTKLRETLAQVAQAECNVLITGETGTGKEMVADLIHSQGSRKEHPFVCINCAAIPDTLLESELFGYDRGAFTGANATRDGKMLQANGGTLFFDEVGEMPLYSQAKILRAIESRTIQRIGGRGTIPIDVRIVAATNQDVECLSEKHLFRRDLLFRLNVLRVHLPALRDRREDIPPLVDHYLRFFNQKSKSGYKALTKEAMRAMQNYSWPGNIRELRNVIEATFVTCTTKEIQPSDLPPYIGKPANTADNRPSLRREELLNALALTDWNISKVAETLNWSRMTVYRKMSLYGIEHPSRRDVTVPELTPY